MVESLRFLLRQIYAGPFTEYVIRNPLIERELGRGIDNDQFRDGVNKLVNGN